MKTHFKNPANHFAMLLMALAMSLAFLACEEKKKPGAEQAEAEAEAPPAEEASEAEGTPHEIQYGEPLTYKGQTYKTVIIGEQTWMAENLNYKTDNSWCYNNDETNCKKYGRLYKRNTAENACPSGWHLPSHGEWDMLREVTADAYKNLKSKADWSDNKNGTDEFGFSALPGGHRNPNGNFDEIGKSAYWWCTADGDPCYWAITHYKDYMGSDNYDEGNGRSVRCVKDEAGAEAEWCQEKTGPLQTAEATFLEISEELYHWQARFRLTDGDTLVLRSDTKQAQVKNLRKGVMVSVTYTERQGLDEGDCSEYKDLESLTILEK